MRVYFDSDVLIWHLRGKEEARGFFSGFTGNDEYEMWIGALQRAEIVFFMRNEEIEATMKFLAKFQCDPVDQTIIDLAGEIFRKWRPSHGIDVNDAILAASAKLMGGKILTLNTKHYPMNDIIVERPW